MKYNYNFNPACPYHGPMHKNVATIAAALISAMAAGAASAANAKSVSDTNQANQQNNKEARDWSEYMYNKYQSPQALYDQYRAIGYNPLTIMDNGTINGNVPSVPSALPNQSANFDSLANSGNVIANNVMQSEVLNSQAYKNYKEGGKSEAETETIQDLRDAIVKLETAKANWTEQQVKESEAKTNLLKSQKSYTDLTASFTQDQIDVYEQIASNLVMLSDFELKSAIQNLENLKKSGELTDAQIACSNKMIDVYRSQISLNGANANLSNSQSSYVDEQTNSLAFENTDEQRDLRTNEKKGQTYSNLYGSVIGGAYSIVSSVVNQVGNSVEKKRKQFLGKIRKHQLDN